MKTLTLTHLGWWEIRTVEDGSLEYVDVYQLPGGRVVCETSEGVFEGPNIDSACEAVRIIVEEMRLVSTVHVIGQLPPTRKARAARRKSSKEK